MNPGAAGLAALEAGLVVLPMRVLLARQVLQDQQRVRAPVRLRACRWLRKPVHPVRVRVQDVPARAWRPADGPAAAQRLALVGVLAVSEVVYQRTQQPARAWTRWVAQSIRRLWWPMPLRTCQAVVGEVAAAQPQAPWPVGLDPLALAHLAAAALQVAQVAPVVRARQVATRCRCVPACSRGSIRCFP